MVPAAGSLGWEHYDTIDLASGAAKIKQATPGTYASVTVSGPHSITLPGVATT
jgi:hypothetical protein